MINTAYPKRFNRSSGGISQLQAAIRQKPELLPYEGMIIKALQGHYLSAKQMRTALLFLMTNDRDVPPAQVKSEAIRGTGSKKQKVSLQSRRSYRRRKQRSGLSETILIMLVIAFLYVLCIIGKLV
jgi:serine/threonine-protein kinase